MSLKEHLGWLIVTIEEQQDDGLRERKMDLIKNLVTAAVKYVDVCVNQTATLQSGIIDNKVFEEIDVRRSRAHDSLIAQIGIINRLCDKYDIAAIYEGPDDRRSKGDFALDLVRSYFQDRI